MSHFIKLCKECGKIISQCRCPSKDKTKIYSVCEDCKREKTKLKVRVK